MTIRSAMAASTCVLVLAGCVRPTEERVEQDLAVGHGRSESVQVDVHDGLAVIRRLEGARVELWQNAPAVRLRLQVGGSGPRELTIAATNGMPSSELTQISGEGAVITPLPATAPTRATWQVQLPADGVAELRIAPADHQVLEPWRFGVLSDIQEAIDEVQDIYRKINTVSGVRFVLGAGDLTRQGTAEELARFQAELEGLDVPYYATLGNHELGTDPCLFQSYFGRASSHFRFRGVAFTLLDSGSASLDPRVFGWLDGWLASARERTHVVAMHIPPLDPTGVRNGAFANRAEAAKLLQRLASGRVDLTLYGHVHSHYAFENAGIPAHISGGGGALPERFDNIGRHFLVVDVDADSGVQGVQVHRVD